MTRSTQVGLYKTQHRDDVVDLLVRIIQPTVALPGAACVGMPRLFDADAPPEAREKAAQICATECPVAQRCSEWARNRPPKVVSGILGGTLYRGPYPRSTRRRQ